MTVRQLVNEQSRKQYRSSANIGTGPVGGLILAIVALLVVIALWVNQQHSQVEVPSMAGMSRAKAEALLKNVGLNVQATSEEVSDQPAGTVLRTDPAAGMPLDEGAGVKLVLAIPAPAPAASGNTEQPAAEAPPQEASAPAPPAPDVVHTESAVKVPAVIPPAAVVPPPVVPPAVVPPPVVVLPPAPPPSAPPQGPALRPVPDVVGLDRGSAAQMLADNRLWVGLVTEEESGQPVGRVLRTNPRPGTAVQRGTAVDLVIAKYQQVEVPDVVGKDRARAAKVLADEGLSVGSVTEEESSKPAGTVLRTDPAAGTTVKAGSTVNLVVAKAPSKSPSATTPPTNSSGADNQAATKPGAARDERDR